MNLNQPKNLNKSYYKVKCGAHWSKLPCPVIKILLNTGISNLPESNLKQFGAHSWGHWTVGSRWYGHDLTVSFSGLHLEYICWLQDVRGGRRAAAPTADLPPHHARHLRRPRTASAAVCPRCRLHRGPQVATSSWRHRRTDDVIIRSHQLERPSLFSERAMSCDIDRQNRGIVRCDSVTCDWSDFVRFNRNRQSDVHKIQNNTVNR